MLDCAEPSQTSRAPHAVAPQRAPRTAPALLYPRAAHSVTCPATALLPFNRKVETRHGTYQTISSVLCGHQALVARPLGWREWAVMAGVRSSTALFGKRTWAAVVPDGFLVVWMVCTAPMCALALLRACSSRLSVSLRLPYIIAASSLQT